MVRMVRMNRKTWKIRKIRKNRKNQMAHGENRRTKEEQYMKHQVNTIYKYA